MSNYKIVRYKEKYINRLSWLFLQFVKEKNLKKALWDEEIKNNLFTFLQTQRRRYIYILKDLENKKVIWFLIWKTEKKEKIYLKSRKNWHISYIFILPEYRWKKLASLLKERFIFDLQQRRIKKISLYTAFKNDNSRKIYSSWWFEKTFILMKKKIKKI